MSDSRREPRVEIISQAPSPDVMEAIHAPLIAFNAQMRNFAPDDPDFAVVVRDPDSDEIIGGLYACDEFGWAFIKYLVVPEDYRGTGLGTRLIQEAEEIARGRGYAGVWLSTYDFQARPFYEKMGYKLFGELEGGEGITATYFLKKKFARNPD